MKKHKIDFEKLKDIQSNNLGSTLGPKVDARAVEGDIGVVIEVEVERERERVREGERAREVEEKKEKDIVLPFKTEVFSSAWKAWTD